MANKITYTVQTTNTTKPVEYWNPYTNQYQDTNPLTGIPDGTYSGFKARLKGSSPEIVSLYTGNVILNSGSTQPGNNNNNNNTIKPNLIFNSERFDLYPGVNFYQAGFYDAVSTDPLGGNTMYTLSVYDSNAQLLVGDVDLTVGTVYCFSGIVKSGDTMGVEVFNVITEGVNSNFDIKNNQINNTTNAVCHLTDLSSQGAQWAGYYLFEVTVTAVLAVQKFSLMMNYPNGAKLKVWHFQINEGDRRTTYQPKTPPQ